jgi:glycosyltransferase involved in cell wall biosynthesis
MSAGASDRSTEITLCLPSLRGGGVEAAMVRLANELAARGYPVRLLVVRAEGPWADEVAEAVTIVDLNRPRVLAAFFDLRRYLRGHQGVFVSNMTHLNVVSLAASLFLRSRPALFVVEHNDLQVRLDRMNSLARALARLLLAGFYRHADQVLAVSRDLVLDLARILGFDREEVRVLPNGLDLAAIEKLANEPVSPVELDEGLPLVVAIGRLVPQKGFSYLLDAMGRVLQEVDARLLVLGEGPLRAALEAQAEALGIGDSLRFPGFVSNPHAILKRADLFVLSSVYEGFGIVVLEAMVCRTPVVAADCHWGPSELLLDGEAGILVPPVDVEALAEGILSVLRAPGQARAAAERAYQAAREYDISRVADIFISLAREVLGSDPGERLK